MAKVKGKLIAACYVDGKLQPEGAEVEIAEELADFFFGTPAQLEAKAKAEEEAAKAEKKNK